MKLTLLLIFAGLAVAQPAVPTNPRASMASDGRVQLYWDAVTGADRYEVDAQRQQPRQSAVLPSPANALFDAAPDSGFSFYSVRACDYANRCSGWSQRFFAVVSAAVACPAPPHGSLIGCVSAATGGPTLGVIPASTSGQLIDIFAYWLPGLPVLNNATAVVNDGSIGTWRGYIPLSAGTYRWRIATGGGARLAVDGVTLFDSYGSPGTFSAVEAQHGGGWHLVEFATNLTALAWVQLGVSAK